MKIRLFETVFLAASLLLLTSVDHLKVAAQSGNQIERVSVASDGKQANSISTSPAISADGRWVVFESEATNLVSGDTNGVMDIFAHDRQTGQTLRVSVASDGTQANGGSYHAAVSASGRWVVFESAASSLVAGDTNGKTDVFVYDRETGVTRRVSVASNGAQGNETSGHPAISADGRWVAFHSFANNLISGDTNVTTDVFVHDRETGETRRVSVASNGDEANSYSGEPSISEDGRWVAFESGAANLVGDDTNAAPDIFLHDRETGETRRVSVASDGTQGNNGSFAPAISADSIWIAFYSYASNLVADDTNAKSDVFLHNRQTGQTRRISVASSGAQANDLSNTLSISGDGRLVAFASRADNLVIGDTNDVTDVFLHNQEIGETVRVSTTANGSQAADYSNYPSISDDGRWIAFTSPAKNLVAGDTNDTLDVFAAPAPFIPVLSYFTTSTPTLTWNRISWATHYEIEIDADPTFATVARYTRVINDLSHKVETPLRDGIWHWRVRAAGGAWSPLERFVVDTPQP